ncbi:MAG TPA: hypothetical protein VGJ09_15235 [Bryobacteraceae bacterium]
MTRALCIGLLCACLVSAQGKGNGKGKGKGSEESSAPSGQLSFGRDRDVIRQYCRKIPAGNLPPGLAKRGGDLPPGLAKQLQRNGHLPPGLEKKLYPFPVELERRLPPLPPDYGRAFIGGNAVIYNRSTSVVIDIFIPF